MVDVLEGIRILDFSIWLFGPGCTQALGDFGAEVIKVEPPTGEPGRDFGRGYPEVNGMATSFASRNRNKKSICIDLRQPESKQIIRRLVETSDVAVQNFRPGVAERLGLTYAEFAAINPRLIYVVGTGYGATGPYQHKGGQDYAAQAMSGLMSVTGDPEWPPVPMGQPIIDYLGAMHLAQGILLALLARQKTGRGQRVDVSLLETALAGGIQACTQVLNTGQAQGKRFRPLMQCYKTRDSYIQLITVFVRGGKPLPLVCEVLEIEDLSQEARFATPEKQEQNARELRDILQQAFLQRTTADWLARLEARDIICAPVYGYGEVFQDPQIQHNRIVEEVEHPAVGKLRLLGTPVKLSETPGHAHLPPPTLGQHTDEVLADLGFSAAEIAALRGSGVVSGGNRQASPAR